MTKADFRNMLANRVFAFVFPRPHPPGVTGVAMMKHMILVLVPGFIWNATQQPWQTACSDGYDYVVKETFAACSGQVADHRSPPASQAFGGWRACALTHAMAPATFSFCCLCLLFAPIMNPKQSEWTQNNSAPYPG